MSGKTITSDDSDLAALLSAAAGRHQAGDLAAADAQYRAVLQRAPNDPQALYLAGALAFQTGATDDARAKLERSLTLRPNYLPAVEMLGAAAAKAGDFTRAVQCFEAAAAGKPDTAEAHYNLGYAHFNTQAYDTAAGALVCAVQLKPHYGDALLLLATTQRLRGHFDEAAAAYRDILAIEPNNARVLDEYGGVLVALGRSAEAEPVLRRAIAAAPDMANPYTNLGRIFQNELARAEEALVLHDKALARRPDYADAHNNRGAALYTLSRFAEAIEGFTRAVALKPTLAEAFNNLGNALLRTGDITGAIDNFKRAVSLKPDYAEAHWNMAVAYLMQDDLAAGWTEYEWRWRCKDFPSRPRSFPQSKWDGRPSDGALLLWGEQGLGEEILCGGMAADLIERGIRVVWEADARLLPLLRRSFPGTPVVARGDQTPPTPAQISTASLGQYLRRAPADFPTQRAAYFQADKKRATQYRADLLQGGHGRLIGVSWISKNPEFGVHKTSTLKTLAPLWSGAGTRFVDLQYGDTQTERADAGLDLAHVSDLDLTNDIDGLAALIAGCDLVITVSNTTAHLAGALGVPVWVMAPVGNGKLWYWGNGAGQSLWYPTATVFRQSIAGSWTDVVAEIAQCLADGQ